MSTAFSVKVRIAVAAVALSQAVLRAEETNAPAWPDNAILKIAVERCAANPLIGARQLSSLGGNINGPSVIRVPSWVHAPLGRYYMYFAHHSGKYIRLAYADALQGPWRIHEPGALRLDQAGAFGNHIASPDVLIDEARQELRMYFHGATSNGQHTAVATSTNGVAFVASKALLGDPYFRVFRWKDSYYAIAKDGDSGWGTLYRSADGLTSFESRGRFIRRMRHAAVLVRGDQLLVFYSRAGDAPERIVVATVSLAGDWKEWRESEPIDVIQPQKKYEGVDYPNEPSKYGGGLRVRQLRDPCIFEEDGHTYLFYTVAGEMGIAMAELTVTMKPKATPAP